MLKRITTAGVALAAMGAFALGGSVIAAAKPASHHAKSRTAARHSLRVHAADTSAEAPSSATDAPGGADVQSGDQSGGPDTGSATAETSTSESSAETPGADADGPGGPDVQSGGNTQQ